MAWNINLLLTALSSVEIGHGSEIGMFMAQSHTPTELKNQICEWFLFNQNAPNSFEVGASKTSTPLGSSCDGLGPPATTALRFSVAYLGLHKRGGQIFDHTKRYPVHPYPSTL